MPQFLPALVPGNIKTGGISLFHQNLEEVVRIFGPWVSRSENFPGFKLSTGKILDFSTFNPKIFRPGNFQSKIFWVLKISSRKKFPKTSIPDDPVMAGLRRGSELVV
jgi:hypothetical protein